MHERPDENVVGHVVKEVEDLDIHDIGGFLATKEPYALGPHSTLGPSAMRNLLNLGDVLCGHAIQEPDGSLLWCRRAPGLLGASRQSDHSDERCCYGAHKTDP